MRRHASLKAAHAALTDMVETGAGDVLVPVVEDVATLLDELQSVGIVATVRAQ